MTASQSNRAVRDHVALRRLIEARLKDSRPATNPGDAWVAGLSLAADPAIRQYFPPAPIAAAVLIPIIDHRNGLSVLLTQRSSRMRTHAGQIAFPGGRVESTDAGPLEAALRETEEEIGLSREHVSFAGYLDPHLVLSGFWVTPVVGFVRPGFELKLDQREVESTLEVPLEHIFDEANHQFRERLIGTTPVQVHDIPFGALHIWGATAGMLMELYRLVRQEGDGVMG